MQPKTPPEVPDTAATRLLATINVRPEQQIELAEMPTATIESAIADGSARDGIRDLAGWVVSLLRAHRDYGWKITPPPPRPDSPEALRAAFARYAAQQEAACHAGMDDSTPVWFPSPPPAMLSLPDAPTRLWNEVQASLKLQITRAEFDAWIRCAALHSVEGGVATIVVPNARVKEGLECRFLSQLRELLTMHIGESIKVRVILNGALPEGAGVAAPDHEQPPTPLAPQPLLPPVSAPDPARRPAWIGAEQWEVLPAMLRAALIGSTFVNGDVQAASPYLDRILRMRYAREVAELIASVGAGSS